ncbi:hypothetical protein EMIT0P4_120021 [Pseudomonas sp. IT-P4]
MRLSEPLLSLYSQHKAGRLLAKTVQAYRFLQLHRFIVHVHREQARSYRDQVRLERYAHG